MSQSGWGRGQCAYITPQDRAPRSEQENHWSYYFSTFGSSSPNTHSRVSSFHHLFSSPFFILLLILPCFFVHCVFSFFFPSFLSSFFDSFPPSFFLRFLDFPFLPHLLSFFFPCSLILSSVISIDTFVCNYPYFNHLVIVISNYPYQIFAPY